MTTKPSPKTRRRTTSKSPSARTASAKTSHSGRQRAYAHLRNFILTDPSAPGTFLSEQELAKTIGVSRTPVREALLMLASEDLIRLMPNRGAFIAPLGPEEIRQIMHARSMIESWVARGAMSRKQVPAAAMAERLAAQRALPADASVTDFIELDRAFHLALVHSAGNPVLNQMYELLHARQVALGVRALKQSPQRRAQVLEEHQRIVEALAGGDSAAAEQAILAHLDSTYRTLMMGG